MLYVDVLHDCFGVDAKAVREVKGGWSAKAYKVDTGTCAYFLKVYDKSQTSVQPWIERIDAYIPVLGWLAETEELRGRVVQPIAELGGTYKVETEAFVFLLFAYVSGDTPGERGLSRAQAEELAGTFARLHSLGDRVPCDTQGLYEDISLSFCEKLACYLDQPSNQSMLSRVVHPEADVIRAAITETIRLRDKARVNAPALVLCHTDAHYNNVIQSDRLVLADWEDLRIAPAEADLFMYALSDHWPAFWNAYAAIRRDFTISADLMRYYLIRRRLDDIWYYVSRVLFDAPGESETARICDRLRSAFAETRLLLSAEYTLWCKRFFN